MGSNSCRTCSLLFGLLCLGGGGYLVWHFLGRPTAQEIKDAITGFDFDDFTNVLGNLTDSLFDDLWDSDPYVGDNSTRAWKNNGNGLSLELLNALDDTWTNEFDVAVADWENGNPDTLTLTVTQGSVDNECKVVNGLMKVCNGNYGDTGWLGINEMIISGGDTIDSSVAKMNEYYLRNADFDKRRYTMCHEIGHGFGLPHTDEQFDNTDLGNCLDYTNNPSANLRPGAVNYNRLEEIYGTVGRRQLRFHDPNADDGRTPYTRELMAKYDSAMVELQAVMKASKNGEGKWRRLKELPRGGAFSRKLDEQYTLKVEMVYAEDP